MHLKVSTKDRKVIINEIRFEEQRGGTRYDTDHHERKNLSAEDAVAFAVNRAMYPKILKAGYASIAFDLWGHDNPERVWDALSTPVLDLKFDKLQENLIEGISEKESVDYETAICYFLIFTMDYLGYHI